MSSDRPRNTRPAESSLTVGGVSYWKRPHHRGPGHDWLRVVDSATGRRSVPGLEVAQLLDEIERLRSWKAQATEVIEGWELVHEALGKPGELGQVHSNAVLIEVERLLAAAGGGVPEEGAP